MQQDGQTSSTWLETAWNKLLIEGQKILAGDASDRTYIIIAIVIVLITSLLISRVRKKKHNLRFYNLKSPEQLNTKPESITEYLKVVLSYHWAAYIISVIVPIIFSLLFQKTLLALFALWGFLVTTLSAFYAHRADYSSNEALKASREALNEAIKTRNAVVHFADSLDMFVSKVRLELLEHKAKGDCISIKFLTVNPAFGHVGMGPEYQRTATDKQFHNFLFDIVHDTTQWNIEILTHECFQAKDWLHNILSATDMNLKAIQEKVNSLYEEQRQFVEKLADDIEASRVRVRFWKPSELQNIRTLYEDEEDIKRVKIPFQFFMIKPFETFKKNGPRDLENSLPSDPKLLKVFFLFSGDFLYDFVFKILPDEDRAGMNMKKLSSLTKGYYTDDKDLVEIFDNIFESFFRKMPELQPRHSEDFFPSVSWIFEQSGEARKSKKMVG